MGSDSGYSTASTATDDTEWGFYGDIYEQIFSNLKDIGRSIDCYPMPTFCRSILPPVSDGHVLSVVNELKLRNVVDATTGRWSAFGPYPAQQTSLESTIFLPIERLVEDIKSATIKARKVASLPDRDPQYSYFNNPEKIPISFATLNKTRPDGYLIDNTTTPNELYWKDICLVAQYKKHNRAEDSNDNVSKLVWGMKHCMLENPRRSFVFGLTIENTTARIWYSDRSQIVVSEPFDFIEDTTYFVHLFVSLLFGDYKDLGLNPTIRSVDRPPRVGQSNTADDFPWEYDYLFPNGRCFRTKGKLKFGDKTRSLIGRCTRVWDVKEVIVDPSTNEERESGEYTLKDTWTDDDRRREGEVYQMLDNLPLSKTRKDALMERLLKVVCYADVAEGDWIEKTRDLSTEKATTKGRFYLVKVDRDTDSARMAQIRGLQPTAGAPSAVLQEHLFNSLPDLPTQRRKVHNLIVFEGSGTPLHSVTSVETVFQAIRDVSAALFVLHAHGWVHRNISIDNILVYEDQSAKLIDFEHAKHRDDDYVHEIRTGNAQFIPIEVQAERYLFRPTGQTATRSGMNDEKIEFWLSGAYKKAPKALNLDASPSPPPPEPIFVYNPLHDLEALGWVGITFLVNRRVVSQGSKRPAHDVYALRKQYALSRAVSFDAETRRALITAAELFHDAVVVHLHPLVVPLGNALDKFRGVLVQRYTEAEKDVASIGFESADGLHIELIKLLWNANTGGDDIIVDELNAEELMDPNDDVYARSKKPRAGSFSGDVSP